MTETKAEGLLSNLLKELQMSDLSTTRKIHILSFLLDEYRGKRVDEHLDVAFKEIEAGRGLYDVYASLSLALCEEDEDEPVEL